MTSRVAAHVTLLKPVQVPERLVAGEKFVKWDEVRFHSLACFVMLCLSTLPQLATCGPPHSMYVNTAILAQILPACSSDMTAIAARLVRLSGLTRDCPCIPFTRYPVIPVYFPLGFVESSMN